MEETAYHESGHAFMAVYSGGQIDEIRDVLTFWNLRGRTQ